MGERRLPVGPGLVFMAMTAFSLTTLELSVDPAKVVTLVVVLLLELTSVRVAGKAFVGLTGFGYVVAYQAVGWGWASVCLLMGLSLRNLSRQGGMAWLVDGLTLQLALGCAVLLTQFKFHPLLVVVALVGAYWLAATELPGQLKRLVCEDARARFISIHQATLGARLGAVFLGLALAGIDPPRLALAAVGLALVQRLVVQILPTVEARDRLVLEKRLSGVAAHLQQTEGELAETRESLTRISSENEFLQNFTTELLRCPSSAEMLRTCLDAAQTQVGASNAAFFRSQGGSLTLETHLGERISRDDIQLAGLTEPCAERAWSSQAIVVEENTEPKGRIFTHDRYTLAFPMGSLGVLYLGSLRPVQLSAERHILLSSLASLSGMAVRLAEDFESRNDGGGSLNSSFR